jgi:hypothetical protein
MDVNFSKHRKYHLKMKLNLLDQPFVQPVLELQHVITQEIIRGDLTIQEHLNCDDFIAEFYS